MSTSAAEPLVDVNDVVRRVVSARIRDQHLVEDLTQEALVRVAAISGRLDPDATRAYAIVTARNLIAGHARTEATHRRHQHRLVDYRGFDGPEQLALERDETDALAMALQHLDAEDRALLLRHEADGEPLDRLAADAATSEGSIKMRLARARAALRVEFVLTFRRVTLPTRHCRNVLMSLSAGDRRRQRGLDAARHLLACPTCADLARPVTERNRGIAAWLMVPTGEAVRRFVNVLRRSHVAQATVATTVAVAATAGFVLTRPDDPQSPPVAAVATTTVATTTVATTTVATTTVATTTTTTAAPAVCTPPVPLDQTDPAGLVGCGFAPTALTPIDVPVDEGFWAATADGREMWVNLTGTGESPVDVQAGQPVAVTGTVVAAPADPTTIGLPAGGDPRLSELGYYLQVDINGVTPI